MKFKKQHGFVSWAVIIFLVFLSVAFYMMEQSSKQEVVSRLRNTSPVLTAEQMKQIDDFRAKPSPAVAPSGIYRGRVDNDGQSLEISYYFGSDSTLTKTLDVEDISFNGSAKYSIKGSTLAFTDIAGDKGLFSPQGEAFTVDGDNLKFPGSEISFTLAKEVE